MAEPSGPPIRLGLVDDHPGVRQGFAVLLEQAGCEVCFAVGNAAAALAGVAGKEPDVLVVDLHLGNDDGVALIRAVADRHPAIAVVVYSMYQDAVRVRRALSAGAAGYVTKNESTDVLAEAVAEVAAGRRYLSPRCRHVMDQAPVSPGAVDVRTTLSDQEYRVFSALGEGWTTVEIAARMGISRRTVETYYRRIQLKLDAPGIPELRRMAIEHHKS